MSELVSVLIPAYNAEHWVEPAIRSALAQTWPRIEVIVVDDGSTDETLAVARRVANRAVKVVSQPNMGAPAARNAAYALAQGSYIQWLDADDLLDRRKITLQMETAARLADRRVLLSCSFGTFYYSTERASFVPTSLWRNLAPVDYFVTRFTDNVWLQTGTWLVSRELSDAVGPWTDVGSPDDDGEYFGRVVTKSTAVRFVPGARAYYRVGNFGSVNNARSATALKALFESKAKCVGYLLSLEDSPRTRTAALRLLQDLLPYFYPEQREIVDAADRLARSLGGSLERPTLKWKYRPLEWLFGYGSAMRVSRALPRLKVAAARETDRLLFRISPQGKMGHGRGIAAERS